MGRKRVEKGKGRTSTKGEAEDKKKTIIYRK